MLSDLKEMGFKVVVSQDPVIAQANKKQWEEADRLGYFVKDSTNGKSYDMPWPWRSVCSSLLQAGSPMSVQKPKIPSSIGFC